MNEEVNHEHDSDSSATYVEYRKTMKNLAAASLLPKFELVTFDGNPLRYYIFVKSFETNIEKDTDDYSRQLQLLINFVLAKQRK